MIQRCNPQRLSAIASAYGTKDFAAVARGQAIENIVANECPIAAVVRDVKIAIGIFAEHGRTQSRTQH